MDLTKLETILNDLKALNSILYNYDENKDQVIRKINLIISIIDYEFFKKLELGVITADDRMSVGSMEFVKSPSLSLRLVIDRICGLPSMSLLTF